MHIHIKYNYGWRSIDLVSSTISETCTTINQCIKYSYIPVDVPYFIKTVTWYDYYIGDVHYTSDQLPAHLSRHHPEFLI